MFKHSKIVQCECFAHFFNFRVDIGASQPASLSYLAFEGATKRNRPNINVGDIVYAKVGPINIDLFQVENHIMRNVPLILQLITASRDTEPEIVCINSNQKSAGMGAVEGGGMLFTVPLNLSRKLINKVRVSLSKNKSVRRGVSLPVLF